MSARGAATAGDHSDELAELGYKHELDGSGKFASARAVLLQPRPARAGDAVMTRMFIDGEWCDAASGATVEATSPATGESLGPVAEGGREDARRAIAAANAAFPSWAARTGFERAELLHRVADAIERRRDELARILTLDQGKPLKAEAEGETDELAEFFRMAAEDGKRVQGIIPESAAPGRRVLLLRRPLGVLGLITPWNWPYTMPAEVLAPALACGNAVVWTPAPSTAVCSGVLAECVAEADLPPGVFNMVLGPGPEVGDEIAANPGTRAVAFTGSTATGLTVARRAAGKAQLLEMGGNGPFVVLADADLEAAATAASVGCFLGAGQSCSAAERLLVHEAVREEFVALLAAEVQREVRLGDPLDDGTTMGPLNNEPGAYKMDQHVADAVDRGATIVTGGSRADGFPTSLYWQPTVLDRVPADSIAVTHETFGPIAPVVGIGSLEEAIEQTNSQTYGLMAAIFTRDLAAGMRYADSVPMGLVNINETTNYWELHLPWGGRARSESGIGRVGGPYPMDTLTELQTVMFRP